METKNSFCLLSIFVLFFLLAGSSAAAQADISAGNGFFAEEIGLLFKLLSYNPMDAVTSMVVYSYGGSEEQVLGRFATWCGKVNVHTNGSGDWVADDDCSSGCEWHGISYCRKFWPETSSIREVAVSDTMKPFKTAGCGLTYYRKGHNEYECLAEVSANDCGDGTPHGECSCNSPKYCDYGELVDDCQECGCPEWMECLENGSCMKAEDEKIMPPCGDGICSEYENPDNCPEDCVHVPFEIIQFCGDGKCSGDETQENCPEDCGEKSANEKYMTRYSGREVFLVSDRNWREVLTLVPVTTWTGNEECERGQEAPEDVCVYPALIYHDETQDGKGLDADSIIHFMQQYDTERVTTIGKSPKKLENLLITKPESGAGLARSQINSISSVNYLGYWTCFEDVVYVEDDYEKALMASVYASLINAPLLIKNYNDWFDLSKKNVICVGNPSWKCDERYTLSQLQQRYADMTGTDKVILTNSRLDIDKEDVKITERGGEITSLFGKTSLSAPYLASSKKEIIITVKATEAEPVDNHLKNRIRELDFRPQYLTVMASPLEIQNTISFEIHEGREVDWSIDNTKYGNMDDDMYGFAELKTGRIYGFSISDVSSYIARDLFHDRLEEGENLLFVGQGVGAADEDAEMLADIFSNAGYSTDYRTYDNPVSPEDMGNKRLMNIASHGSTGGTSVSTGEVPGLSNTIILTSSCMLCAFDSLYKDRYGELFCLELIRKGSLGAIVSVDTAGFNWDSTRLNNVLSKDLGTVFKRFQNFNHARNKWYIEDLEEGEDTYETLQSDIQMLLGDPTLHVPFENAILPDTEYEINYIPAGSPDTISIDVRIPSINVKSGENGNTHAFIEGTDSFVQAKFAKFFLKIGPIDLFENYYVESGDVNPAFHGGIKDVAVQQEEDGTYIYFLIEKRILSNPLDIVTWNDINIKIISGACNDGTPYGECSPDIRKYCDEGKLVDDCKKCGCPDGMECSEEGMCYSPLSKLEGEKEMISIRKGEAEEYEGFIVEFEEAPLAEEKWAIEKSVTESWWYNTPLRRFFYSEDRLRSTLEKRKETLKSRADMLEMDAEILLRRKVEIGHEFDTVFSGALVDVSSREAEMLKGLGYVKEVHPNYIVSSSLMDSVGIIMAENIDEDGNDCIESGKECLTGKGITIAVLDTGIDYTHPDFGGCTYKEFRKGNCEKVIGGYDFVNDDDNPKDDSGHGTHCAGIAAGDGDLKGVAPGAELLAYKVLDVWARGISSDVMEALEMAIDPDDDGDFSDHVDVISMSLGGAGDPESPLSKAVNNAVKEGVTVVVAAGNNGPWKGSVSAPGNAERAITVGATDKEDIIAGFSSRGPLEWMSGREESMMKPDIVAPGVDICSAMSDSNWIVSGCYDEDHVLMSGTSMAAPHVAGVAALLMEAHPDWRPDEIKTALTISADDLGGDAFAHGAGRVSVADALKTVPGEEGKIEMESPGRIDSGSFDIRGSIKVRGFSGYEISIAKSELMGGNLSWDTVYESSSLPTYGYLARGLQKPSKYGWYLLRLVVGTEKGDRTVYGYVFNPKGERIEIMDGWPQKPLYWEIEFWGVGSTPILKDLDSDGKKEIITFSSDQITVWNHEGKIVKGWDKKIDTGVMSSGSVSPPSIGDIDGDGKEELVKTEFWDVSIENGKLCGHAWNADGSPVKGWKNNCDSEEKKTGYGLSSMYDIDGDGDQEIIMITDDTEREETSVYVVQGDSGVAEGWPRSYGYDRGNDLLVELTFPLADDLDGDGEAEIAVLRNEYSRLNSYPAGSPCDGTLIIFDKDGNVEREIKTTCSSSYTKDILLAVDLDGDGVKEIGFTSKNENIEFYRLDGSKPEGWPFPNFNYQKTHMIASDLTGDGRPEIIFPSFERLDPHRSYLNVLDSGGEKLPGWPKEVYGIVHWVKPQAADVDGDGEAEILSTTTSGILYAFGPEGNPAEGFPIGMGGSSNSGTAVDDVDGDGHPEMFAGLFDGTVYGWRFKTEHNSGRLEWPMWKHDPRNTGIYETPDSEMCYDGTPYGECSYSMPKYCDEGKLVDDCKKCGCPDGMECLENGSCLQAEAGYCEWTMWHDDDDPSGKGDYERVYCPDEGKPVDVECVTLGGTDHSETGEIYTCSVERPGGVCVNSMQEEGYCTDYKVRVCCSEGCRDTDSGDDPYHEGTVTYYDKREGRYVLVEMRDYCQDGKHLFEYWCSNIGLGAGGRRYCPYGCTGGECV